MSSIQTRKSAFVRNETIILINRFKNNLKNRCCFSAFFQASVDSAKHPSHVARVSRCRLPDKQEKKNAGSPRASL